MRPGPNCAADSGPPLLPTPARPQNGAANAAATGRGVCGACFRSHQGKLPGELGREPHVVRIEKREIVAFCRPDASVARRRRTGIAFVANATDLRAEPS